MSVAPIGYGCWRFAGTGVEEATAKIEAALDAFGGDSLTLVDTADIYGFDGQHGFGDAETLLGQVLASSPHLRARMVLATKGGIRPSVPYDQSPRYLREACEASLRRLGVEVIDLYQIHRPDLLAHPEDVADVLIGLVEEGKVRQLGVSNFTVAQTDALLTHLSAEISLATTQPEFHPLALTPMLDGTFDRCMAHDITPLTWSPLGGGRLAGAAAGSPETAPDADADRVGVVADALASIHGVSRPAVLLAWQLTHPAGIVPIVGTQDPRRIEACAAAVTVDLTATQWYELLVAGRGKPMP